MICVPIVAATNQQALGLMKKAAGLADVIELRLDYMEERPNLDLLLENRPLPVIVTNRPVREGGLYEGDETNRVAPLREAVALHADYVDIEHDAVGRLGESLATRVIISYHNWGKTPKNLNEIARMLVGAGGQIIKIATLVRCVSDNFRLCQLAATSGVPIIVTGMGPKGVPSRILARKFGSLLTFAALSKEFISAPGQLTVSDLLHVYNYRLTNRDTKVYGVVGNPIGHSISPHVHNAAFKALGVNAVYVPLEVEDFETFAAGCKCIDPGGFSVTIPHKRAAFELAGETDEVTARIGALNTLKVLDGGFAGTNTDWKAAVESVKNALPEGESLAGKRLLLLGAGGAARAIAYGFASEGALVTIANRTHEKAQKLAGELSCAAVPWEARTQVGYDVLANSTSLGMYPAAETTPFPAEALVAGKVVFDAVYNPRLTRLLEEARAAGCITVDGVEMFVQQAVAQIEFWLGVSAPVDQMRKAAVAGLGSFAEGGR